MGTEHGDGPGGRGVIQMEMEVEMDCKTRDESNAGRRDDWTETESVGACASLPSCL